MKLLLSLIFFSILFFFSISGTNYAEILDSAVRNLIESVKTSWQKIEVVNNKHVESVKTAQELQSTDFGDKDSWFNLQSDTIWFHTDEMNRRLFKNITLSGEAPSDHYAFALTYDGKRRNYTEATLLSKVIACHNGKGVLRFKYWIGESVEINACAKSTPLSSFQFDYCKRFNNVNGGIAEFSVQDINEPLQLYIRAKFDPPVYPFFDPSYAIISDIEYEGDISSYCDAQ